MVKLRDIALKTGMNVSTISRALRDSPDISEETCQLVKQAARDLGYRYRRLEVCRNPVVGVILPEVSSHYYAGLAHSLTGELRKQGYGVFIVLSGFSSKSIDEAYDLLVQQDVCGILICGLAETDTGGMNEWLSDKLVRSEIPVVLLSEVDTAMPIDTIYVDARSCMLIAVEHLMSLGHTEIGYIGEHTSDMRFRILCDILAHKGMVVRPEFVKIGSDRFELGGYLRMRELLQETTLPTAIVACYDQVAIGAMKALNDKGLCVPKDISIIGIDNIVMDDYLPIRLTSITNPVGQMGVVAVKLLIDNIHNKSDHVVQNVALKSKLVERNSTSIPRQNQGGMNHE